MISITFYYGNQILEVKIINKEIYFAEVKGMKAVFVPIENIRLSEEGIIKEFPDLKSYSYDDMRKEAIKRFRKKIESMKNEEEIMKYVINDLSQYGYIAKLYKKDNLNPTLI